MAVTQSVELKRMYTTFSKLIYIAQTDVVFWLLNL